MNIVEKLKHFNVEVTAEMEKAFAGDFLSEKEVEKKLSKAESDRDAWKERAETAEETLKKFDGKDVDAMQKEIDVWKKKAEDAEKNFTAKEAEREFREVLKEIITEAKGKNEKAILANLDIDSLMKSRNQREDVKKAVESLKTSEETSFLFLNDKNDTQRITSGTVNNNNSGSGILTEKEIGAIKDTRERQKAWAEKIAHDNSINKN